LKPKVQMSHQSGIAQLGLCVQTAMHVSCKQCATSLYHAGATMLEPNKCTNRSSICWLNQLCAGPVMLLQEGQKLACLLWHPVATLADQAVHNLQQCTKFSNAASFKEVQIAHHQDMHADSCLATSPDQQVGCVTRTLVQTHSGLYR